MKTLNLVDLSKSDIKYKISKFPDGQQSITLDENSIDIESDIKSITIKSRMNNFLDVEIIICAVKALRTWGLFYPIDLYVPYFLGSRSDRAFGVYSPNYLRDVICPIINSLDFNSVTVLDPHSDVLEACLNNFRKENNWALLTKFIEDVYLSKNKAMVDNCILISPDAGASKKIYKLAETIGYKGDIITCSKDRDTEGKLTKCIVPMKPKYTTKDLIIIDDICDGGATFINIAKAIDDYNKNYKSIYGKKYLIITHGIFSKGFKELSEYFDGVYCTNSYRDITHGECPELKYKQLNIF